MCNDYANHVPYDEYRRAFSDTKIPVRFPDAAPNLQPRDDIWPTDTAPVIRQAEDGPPALSAEGARDGFQADPLTSLPCRPARVVDVEREVRVPILLAELH